MEQPGEIWKEILQNACANNDTVFLVWFQWNLIRSKEAMNFGLSQIFFYSWEAEHTLGSSKQGTQSAYRAAFNTK